jgi:hypothetical protein
MEDSIMRQTSKCLLLFVLFGIFGCKDNKEEAKKAPATPVTNPNPTGDGGVGNAAGPGKTKAQCDAEERAWIAVVNSGQSPSTCADPLSLWGCCPEQITARFSTLAQDLSSKINAKLGENYKLYHCSSSGDRSHKLHFARFPGGGRTEYYEISIDAFAYEPSGAVADCPRIPQVDFPAGVDDPGPSASPTPGDTQIVQVVAFADVNRILKADCAGSGCHGSAGTGSGLVVYEDSEANTKAGKAAILDRIGRAATAAGVMPPGRNLNAADIDLLTRYLNQ